MLAALFAWWTEQMRDLIAPLTRRSSAGSQDALVIASDPEGDGNWCIARRRNGITTVFTRLGVESSDAAWHEATASRRRGEPVVIAMDQPFLVRRTTLPLAAASNLDQLLAYELDRLTPFPARDVLFSWRVVSRDTAAATLLVDIAVVPKAWVRNLLERLEALAVRPTALEAPEPAPTLSPAGEWPAPGAPRPDYIRRIALDHTDPALQARTRLRWRIGTGMCAALAVAVIAVPFIRQSLALAQVEAQIASLRPRMDQVDALRRQIAAGSAGAGQIAAARDRGTVALRALGVLTDLLPDDTFLTSIALRRAHLTIEGHSAAATKLIAAMTAESQLRNPSFGAPVVRAENGTDIFTIQAGFGP